MCHLVTVSVHLDGHALVSLADHDNNLKEINVVINVVISDSISFPHQSLMTYFWHQVVFSCCTCWKTEP